MAIRMLHHRTKPARAGTDAPLRVFPSPAPAVAPGASTARTSLTVAAALRRTAAGPGRGLTHRHPAAVARGQESARRLRARWSRGRVALGLWADLARGYLALALALLPHGRPPHTVTAFAATADTLSARPGGPAPHRHARNDARPGRDATP